MEQTIDRTLSRSAGFKVCMAVKVCPFIVALVTIAAPFALVAMDRASAFRSARIASSAD
jgi:hypothetical protein